MTQHLLEPGILRRVHAAAVEAGFCERRDLLVQRLPPAVVAALPKERRGVDQLDADLHALNRMDYLDDGRHPLEVWLEWAGGAAEAPALADVFRRAIEGRGRGTHLERPGARRYALTVRVDGARRRYSSGATELLTLDNAAPKPPGPGAAPAELFHWLFPAQYTGRVFRAMSGEPYPTRRAVACRVVCPGVEDPPPLWTAEWQSARLVATAAPWTFELGFDEQPPRRVRIGPGGMRVALLASAAGRRDAAELRSLLTVHSAEFHAAERCGLAQEAGQVAAVLSRSQPEVVVLLEPDADMAGAVVRWLAARGRSTSLVVWATADGVPARPAALTEVDALVTLGAGGVEDRGTRAGLLRHLVRATALLGEDPVEALHSPYRPRDRTAVRRYLERHARVRTRFSGWAVEPVPRARRPHPRTALDRIAQRGQVSFTIEQDQLPNGRRLQAFVCTGGPGTDVRHLSRALLTTLRTARLQPRHIVIPECAGPPDGYRERWLRVLADTLGADLADEVGVAQAIGRSRPVSADRPYLWLDVGCHDPDAANCPDLGVMLTTLVEVAVAHPWSGALPVGVFLGLRTTDPDVAAELAEQASPAGAEARADADVEAVLPLSTTVTRKELTVYFSHRGYSPDTLPLAQELTEAVSRHTRDYGEALRCIHVGVQHGWDTLLDRLAAAAEGADPFAGLTLDREDEYFDLGEA